MSNPIKSLGSKVTEYSGLETFPTPSGVSLVTLVSDEVTALCPVTSQPDWYTVKMEYVPGEFCIESKTWKLFLGSLRQEGMFCEALSVKIMKEVQEGVDPVSIHVWITQKPRGGVSIIAESIYRKGE